MARAEGLVFRKSHQPVPKVTVNAMLRNRIHAGDFDWNGITHHGVHEA